MSNPRNISIQDYNYSLPEEKIAKYPLANRDDSKLLVYNKGKITEDIYKNIANQLPEDSLLIFNNTKVVEARLLFQKATGGVIEIFCLEPHEQYADITTAMLQKEKVFWQCLVGGASKWKSGQVLEKRIKHEGKEIILSASYIEKRTSSFIIELSWTPTELSFAEILHFAGAIPLPPYIKREVEEADHERYQTVYAEFDGSVAAPTAGLHFTDSIFESLKKKNIQKDFVTLHVGAGTFKPVKSETMEEHDMHAEWINVSKETIQNILKNLDKNIIAVGTTSLRTIESLYWIGRRTERSSIKGLSERSSGSQISQWEAYELAKEEIPVKVALHSLLNWMTENKLERLVTKTQILIAPGYEFKIIKGLITNFHQPQSTLLLLVAALIGDDLPSGLAPQKLCEGVQAGWKKIYDYAMQNNFRFLSYGDGSLLWRNET